MDFARADFETLLEEAAAFHGHLCGGQIIGVRMAIAGLREIGIKDPKGSDSPDLIVFVETDRCAADAIIAVTGRRPGRRNLKMFDYGKMAATFVNLRTDKAVRVNVRSESRKISDELAETRFAGLDDWTAQLEALRSLTEDELLHIREVSVVLRPEDLPGDPLDEIVCDKCGETVKDWREITANDMVLCRPCYEGRDYYKLVDRAGR